MAPRPRPALLVSLAALIKFLLIHLFKIFAAVRAAYSYIVNGSDSLHRFPPPPGAHHMQIVAHRGASVAAPENTFAALTAAADAGVTVVECDVHRTIDDEVVVVHDKTMARTGRAVAGEDGSDSAVPLPRGGLLGTSIDQLTLAQLQSLDVGSFHKPPRGGSKGGSSPFAEERIPTLGPFLEAAKERGVVLFLEIKGGAADTKLVELACGLVREAGTSKGGETAVTCLLFVCAYCMRLRQRHWSQRR